MKRFYALILTLLFFVPEVFAQDYLGFRQNNYAGINQIAIQPAALADGRLKYDVNLVGASIGFGNNYFDIEREGLFAIGSFTSDTPFFTGFRDAFLQDDGLAAGDKSMFIGVDLQLLSFSYQTGPNDAIGFSWRHRQIVNLDNFSPELAKLGVESIEHPPLWKQTFDATGTSVDAMGWNEFGFNYSRVLMDDGEHFLKGGGTVKAIQGIHSAYMYLEDVSYNFTNDDTLTIGATSGNTSDVSYGHTESFELDEGLYAFEAEGWGLGFDFGVVYEYRPDYEDYTMAYADQDVTRNDLNKYKLKIGASILDIGSVRFDKDAVDSYDFNADITNWDLTKIKIDDIQSWDDTLNRRFPTSVMNADNETDYVMTLPLAYSLQVDWRPWMDHEWYANATAFISPLGTDNINKVHHLTRFTFTPRYESTDLGFGIPISYNSMEYLDIGMYFTIGPFYMGSPSFWRNTLGSTTRGIDFFFGFKIGFPHTERKGLTDLDGDGVLDNADECIDVPGPIENNGCPYADKDGDGVTDNADECIDVPGPKENNGCPYEDKDNDGVLDNVDECIDTPGPIENNGCPYGDKDGDGVLDNVDQCVDVAGPAENNGCPIGDKDGDGVPDTEDECIDVAGPAENKGCPYADKDNDGIPDKDDKCIDAPGPAENDGCPYLDTDGDGVLDKDDDCPNTPGDAANKGCPTIKKEEQDIIDRAFDNLEFDTGKDAIRSVSFPSLNELAQLLVTKPSWKLRLSGHTDSVGNDEANMKLSKDRSNAVKNHLIRAGVDGSRITAEWFGETRPIDSNETQAGRQKNRRVEMTIEFE